MYYSLKRWKVPLSLKGICSSKPEKDHDCNLKGCVKIRKFFTRPFIYLSDSSLTSQARSFRSDQRIPLTDCDPVQPGGVFPASLNEPPLFRFFFDTRQFCYGNIQIMMFGKGHEFPDRDLPVFKYFFYFLLKLRIRFILPDQFFYCSYFNPPLS